MELRKYQEECLNKIKEMDKGRKIAFLATGAGKTIIMASIIKEVKGRVLIVVDQSELRKQTIDKIKIVCGNDIESEIGCVQGTLNDVDKRIIIATRQSLTHPKSHRIEDIKAYGDFEIVMMDEVHRAVRQVKKIANIFGINNKIIGFTATPWNQELKTVFDGFIYEKDTLSLIEEKYLCQPRCYRINSNTDLSEVKTVGGEFVQSQLADAVDTVERNSLVVKTYLDYAMNRKHCIVFATSIEHADNLATAFNINGISAKSVDSTCDAVEREKTLNDFKNGKFKVLVNVAILTTGFDMESLDCIIMARPTKSKILYTQCIGRGLRIAEGKDDCLILDIVDNVARHNLLNSKNIFDTKDGETLEEAKERKQYEKEEHEKYLEEQRRIEEEQEKIKLEEISLFNKNIFNVTECSNLDWYFNMINNSTVAILSLNSKVSYYVFKKGEVFKAYKYRQADFGYDYVLSEIDESDNLQELIEDLDTKAIMKGCSFISKSAMWKYEEATEKQKYSCKKNINTKWDAHKYFSNRSSYFALKDII